jgi:hypothetical protein
LVSSTPIDGRSAKLFVWIWLSRVASNAYWNQVPVGSEVADTAKRNEDETGLVRRDTAPTKKRPVSKNVNGSVTNSPG